MTTGDLKNNLRKFHAELKLINYTNELDIEGLGSGRPSAFLPILHYVMTDFSIDLAQYFYSKDHELQGKNDANFLGVVYKILRDEFNSKPPLTKEQFFTFGFAERKLQFVTSVIQLCRKKNDVLKPKRRKHLQGLNTAKTSNINNIHLPIDGPGNTTKLFTGTTCLDNTTLVTMVTKHPSVQCFSETDMVASRQTIGKSKSDDNTPDKSLSKNQLQALQDEVFLPKPVANKENMIPRNNRISQRQLGKARIGNFHNTDMYGPGPWHRPSDSSSQDYVFDSRKNVNCTKENICPNAGSNLNVHALSTQSEKHRMMPSPICLSNKMTSGYDRCSEKHEKDGLNQRSSHIFCHSNDPEYSKHLFATSQSVEDVQDPMTPMIRDPSSKDVFVLQTNKGLDNRAINKAGDESLPNTHPDHHISKQISVTHQRECNQQLSISESVSILPRHSHDYAELLNYAKELEKKVRKLEKEAGKRDNRMEDLLESNSKLTARVMVLETAVALIQEKLES